MKKVILIVVLGLLVTFNVEAVSYLFKDSIYTDCYIFTEKDPTTFQNLVFVKKKILTGGIEEKKK
tara:strand:+ start:9 stop:203 length:195 start_codon:yes stop_codon:yes gene_type:complete